MTAIAIDLGSAFSMVARLNDEGIPTLIGDAQQPDQLRTPSLVHLGASGVLVGQSAEIAWHAEPDAPKIHDFKSMLASGRTLAVDQTKKGWSAEQCATLLLAKLRQDANAYCFESVDEVLITVPSRFTSAQRQAVRQAALDAGLRVRGLIDECVAAAAFATSQSSREQTVLVLQSGRCGFDAAIVRCSQEGALRLAARHDSSLGGKSIDQRLADAICGTQGWTSDTLNRAAVSELLHFAEQLKIALCQSESGQVQRQGVVGKSIIEFILTHWHFQQLVAPMLERAWELIEKCLAEAALDWTKIDQVRLAGGTTQMPLLRSELIQRSGLPSERITGKDSVAAAVYGAALLARLPDEQLAKYVRWPLPGDAVDESAPSRADSGPIALFDFGIRIGDPRSGQAAIYKLIKRGTPLPTTASKQFRTSRAGQPRLVIETVRTAGSVRRAESLGHFSLALPAGLPANHPVMVTMYSDVAGQVRVEAVSSPNQQNDQSCS